MNCLEYRRQLTIDPRSKAANLLAHVHECDACATFSKRLLRMEAKLEQTLDVKPPEGLSSRILLRQTTAASGVKFQNRYLAMAASLTLAVSLTLGWYMSSTLPSLDQVVLHHINDESKHLSEDHQVDMQKLAGVLGAIGGKAQEPFGKVRYASNCPIRKQEGAHVIVEGKQGPVTVLVMPGEHIKSRKAISDKRFRGFIVPVEHGSIAIVGEKDEDISVLEGHVLSSLKLVS